MLRFSIPKWGLAIAASLVLLGSPLVWANEVEKDPHTDAIEQIVREYLLRQPEVIMESLENFRIQQQAAQQQLIKDTVMARQAELVADPTSPVAGAQTESINVVEFFDYRCGYCKGVHATVLNLPTHYPNVRLIFKEFPILGPESDLAAKAALAAHQQGAYLQFHEVLMATNKPVNERFVEQTAKTLNLDLDKLKADMESPKVKNILERNQELAAALGVEATPTFVIGTDVLSGALDAGTFARLISNAEAMRETKAPKAGAN